MIVSRRVRLFVGDCLGLSHQSKFKKDSKLSMLVNSLCRVFSIAKCVSKAHPTNLLLAHHFSSSSKLLFPRQSRNDTPDGQTGRRTHSVLEDDMEDLWDQLEEPADVEDSPSGGHIVLQQQREVLHYMRLIEHEMPKLVGEFLVFAFYSIRLKVI